MLIFRFGLGADVFGTFTMGFTLPIYAHNMAMVLAAQPSPTEASTPSPRYDLRVIDFFDHSAEVDNECHSLDSTSDEGGHEGSTRGVHCNNIIKQRAGKYRVLYIHKRKNLEIS